MEDLFFGEELEIMELPVVRWWSFNLLESQGLCVILRVLVLHRVSSIRCAEEREKASLSLGFNRRLNLTLCDFLLAILIMIRGRSLLYHNNSSSASVRQNFQQVHRTYAYLAQARIRCP